MVFDDEPLVVEPQSQRPHPTEPASVQCYGGLFLTWPQVVPADEEVDLTMWKTILLAQLVAINTETICVDSGIIAKEKHEDGNWHVHAWIHFKGIPNGSKIRVPHRLLDMYGKHGNYQGARSDANVQKYCIKDGDYIFWGMTDPKQRQDCRKRHINLIIADILTGTKSLEQAIQERPSLLLQLDKLQMNLDLMKSLTAKRKEGQMPSLIFIEGPAGVGKSTIAHSLTLPEETFLVPLPSSKGSSWWFDGYHGQQMILFDNISPETAPPYDLICQMVNPSVCRLPVKGRFVLSSASMIVMTSTASPKTIWKNLDHQMMRRMTTYLRAEYVPSTSMMKQALMTQTQVDWMMNNPGLALPEPLLSEDQQPSVWHSHEVTWSQVSLDEWRSPTLPAATVQAMGALHAQLRTQGASIPSWRLPPGLQVTGRLVDPGERSQPVPISSEPGDPAVGTPLANSIQLTGDEYLLYNHSDGFAAEMLPVILPDTDAPITPTQTVVIDLDEE